tara:strand:+ start:286 stop:1533 length:1248 start_codon:yes stop_codon:yes gene_type:complete
MLLQHLLKGFVKVGVLTLIDHKGKTYTFSGAPGPNITLNTHSKSIERRLLHSPSLALGEGWMDGDITIESGDIYDFISFCAVNQNSGAHSTARSLYRGLTPLIQFIGKQNSISRSRKNVEHHYNINKELYELFLDKDFQYSCAYFTNLEDNLEDAQENKKRHIAAKLRINPGDKILDIGSGWGGLAIYLARETGADVTGLTLSQEQLKVATDRAAQAGLSNQVRFHLRDYRHEQGSYDRIVSVGMFEHVGVKGYPDYFKKIHTLLKEDGIALLHSIGCSHGPSTANPWLNKYIFPGGYCPALSETLKEIEPSKLLISDVEVLHHHYAETLHHWRARFMANLGEAKNMMGERFCRMWEFYLACCEVAFRQKGYMVFQIQMVKNIETASLTRDYIAEWESKHGQRGSQMPGRKKIRG